MAYSFPPLNIIVIDINGEVSINKSEGGIDVCKELTEMRKSGVFSKTFVVKILCNKELHNEAVEELKEVSFSNLVFDYIDMERFLTSDVSQKDIDEMVKYLLTFGRVELDLNLVKVLEKYGRESFIELLFSFVKKQRDRQSLLRLASYTNCLSQIRSSDFIDIDAISFRKILDGHVILFDNETGQIIYRDFIGDLKKWKAFMVELSPTFSILDKMRIFFIEHALEKHIRYIQKVFCGSCPRHFF